VCTLGEKECYFGLHATTDNVTDGVVSGPEPSMFETCPHAYGVRTFGPFEAIGVASLVVDLSGPSPSVALAGRVGHAEVGDATANTCGGHSWAAPSARTSTPVPWEKVLSGEPVTLTYAMAGTAPTQAPSASADIRYDKTLAITLQRVKADGAPYGV
jgi:hypothetical protein